MVKTSVKEKIPRMSELPIETGNGGQLTVTQKSGFAAAKLISSSWPIECAASTMLNTPCSAHILTISFQGNTTPGLDTIESMMATRCLPGERERSFSRNKLTTSSCERGKLRSRMERVGCGGTFEMYWAVR